MKLIWYIISLFIIILILINNPKASSLGLGNLINQGQLLNSTRSTERILQLLITGLVLCFFIFTILISVYR